MKKQTAENLAAILLIAAVALYRLCVAYHPGHLLWNFSPVAAVALCGGIYLPRRAAWIVPMGTMFLSDLVLNWHYGVSLATPEMASRYLALAASVGLGMSLRGRAGLGRVLAASVAGSLIFYILTNTSAWLTDAGYAKSASGWAQALTTGLPGYAPTWSFFRATFVSDLLFAALFVSCMAVARREEARLLMATDFCKKT